MAWMNDHLVLSLELSATKITEIWTKDINLFIQPNAFKNVFCEMLSNM